MNVKRLLWTALIVTVVLTALYVVGFVWPAGGVRRQFGRLSGSSLPAGARGMNDERIRAETETRADLIRLAVLAYQRDRGSLPQSLEDLVPSYMPRLPEPLTSTLPFKLQRPKAGGFVIRWEAWPNAAYECYWMDQDGKMAADM